MELAPSYKEAMDLDSSPKNFQERVRDLRETTSNSSWTLLTRDLQWIFSRAVPSPKSTTLSTVEAVWLLDLALVGGCLTMEAETDPRSLSPAIEKWKENVINSLSNPLKSRRSTSQLASGRMCWWGNFPTRIKNKRCLWTRIFKARLLHLRRSHRESTALLIRILALSQSLEQVQSWQHPRRVLQWYEVAQLEKRKVQRQTRTQLWLSSTRSTSMISGLTYRKLKVSP